MQVGFTRGVVSVVIPCHNAGRWIAETLNSVCWQTWPAERMEVVVVDNGSTDDSVTIIEQCKLSNLRLLRTPNHGASRARNLGTAETRGEFIQYVDADDILRPEALCKRVQALEASGADVAYSDWQRLVEDEKGNFVPGEVVRRRIEEVNSDIELAVFSSFWAPPVALLYRRAMVERIGGWNAYHPIIQDARFIQDAAHLGAKFVYVGEVLGEYRTHRHSSLSKRSKVQFEKDILTNNREIEERWERGKHLTAPRRAYMCETYRRSSAFFFWHDFGLFELAHHRARLLGESTACGLPEFYASISRVIGSVNARRMLCPVKMLSDFSRAIFRRIRSLAQRRIAERRTARSVHVE
jgi:glycosyltransferase involved in cell wall biosynthesis